MALPLTEAFGAAAGVLANPPWTQEEATTVNTDGAGRGKASATNNALDLGAFDNSNTYNNDQYAFQTIAGGLSSGHCYAIVYVRCSGTGGSKNNYYLTTDGVNGAAHTAIGKYVGGTQTELLALSPAAAFTTNDVMKLTVTGTTLEAFKNGVSLGTTTDAALASGAAGCGMFNDATGGNQVVLDTWEGGNLGGGGGTTVFAGAYYTMMTQWFEAA